MASGKTRLLFVFGHPVSHSLSPLMQNYAIQKLMEDIQYLPLDVLPVNLKSAVDILRLPNVLGANITIPHKQKVIPFLNELSKEARITGSVNTIVNKRGKLFGDTTDMDGFLTSLEEEGVNPKGMRVTILGSGGSARAIAFAFAMKTKIKNLRMAARSPEKIKPIAKELQRKLGVNICYSGTDQDEIKSILSETDLLVNCTSAGMVPSVDSIPIDPSALHKNLVVYDIVYNPPQTRLLKEAKKRGCKVISGLGMLIHQGKRSLEIWLNRKIPILYFPRKQMERMLAERI